jgi:hypothetical protein
MKAILILAVTNAVIWGLLASLGLALIAGARPEPGFPNTNQLGYYVTTPAVMSGATLLVLLSFLGSRRIRTQLVRTLLGWFTSSVLVAGLVAIPCYLLFYTGAM